jgi:exodeoxyribonuclease VII large subunit
VYRCLHPPLRPISVNFLKKMRDDIPTLADLRRTRRPRTLSLFDEPPPPPPAVTAADVLAEQSRSLNASHPPFPAPARKRPISGQDFVPDAAPEVYTVAELVRRIRSLVERTHGHVTVEGEISNWRPAASGHCYFTLKDGDAQLSIVLFRRQAQLLRFKPKDGDAVRISGQLSVYESRGQLQLIAETMQPTGIGALLAAVQALKERLRREGIFANKRPLPSFPRCIGIVTSLQGAALRDIVKVCRRRHAAVNLLIYPAAVQGPNCAREVAAGIRWFSAHPGKAEVILIARGGGSWEDLHGFDDEQVCRAIHASSIPVLTGIGHATDAVLADSAADLCAPTPSAAAELVTAAQHTVEDRLARLHARLLRGNRYELLRTRQRLSALSADGILARVRNALGRRAQRLDDLSFRAESAFHRALRDRSNRLIRLDARLRRHHPSLRVAEDRHHFASLQQRFSAARTQSFQPAHARLDRATSRMEALSPLRVLDRGYALIYTPDGHLLRNPAEAPPGTLLTAQLAQGRLRGRVIRSE